MSAFWIGQRVRIRHNAPWRGRGPNPGGREGVIVDREPVGLATGATFDWCVSLDPDSRLLACDSDSLEPILPDGLESNEEIDSLYEPSPEVVTVEKRA